MFAEERRIVVVEATLGLRVGTRHGSGLVGSEKMDPWTTLMRQQSGVVGLHEIHENQDSSNSRNPEIAYVQCPFLFRSHFIFQLLEACQGQYLE